MDYLDRLAQDAKRRVGEGYYGDAAPVTSARRSCREAIREAHGSGLNAVIAELKPASPSAGPLLDGGRVPQAIEAYRAAGAAGISVLTDPTHFGGSLEYLKAASATGLPTLMKDFILAPVQLDACVACGGSAVLLILTLFTRGHPRLSLEGMIAEAHARELEVLLEVNSSEEYGRALRTEADMLGINSRDLATHRLDLEVAGRVLAQARKDRLVWALSGIEGPEDLVRLKRAGADAFLVGTSLVRAPDPEAKLKALLHAA